jgi:2-polyprenyl-3-methyl-5-hydroxy-6-metoxy-1,4-benzoquinol methylase
MKEKVKDSEWRWWHEAKFERKRITGNYFLMNFLSKYLPHDQKKSCIEIGCSPGTFLVALKKRFGYTLTGLDIQGFEQTDQTLKFNGIDPKTIDIINSNFFDYNPKKKFDIVCSFGLIEHFKNPQYAFDHLSKFINTGGFMVMGIPRFRGIYWIAHKLMGSGIYHNYDIMKLKSIRKITKNYQTIFCGTYSSLPERKNIIFKLFPPYLIYIGRKK